MCQLDHPTGAGSARAEPTAGWPRDRRLAWPRSASADWGAVAALRGGAEAVLVTSGLEAGARPDIAAAIRVVVKVGSSSLTTADGGIDDDRIGALADALAARVGRGTQVVLVSSGAIAAGLAPLGLPRRPRDLATQQAAASVGQGLLVARYTAAFARHGVR